MALAKKGTRRITIDGQVYRWVVSADDGFMVLVVELASDPGQRMTMGFDYQDIVEPAGEGRLLIVGQRTSISPGVVRAVIMAALGNGWQPAARGLRPYRVKGDLLQQIFAPPRKL